MAESWCVLGPGETMESSLANVTGDDMKEKSVGMYVA